MRVRASGDHGSSAPAADALTEARQAELRHWRAIAAERDAKLRTLTRRPLVRLALGLDRRLAVAGGRARTWRGRLRTAGERCALVVAGALHRRSRASSHNPEPPHAAAPGPAPTRRRVSVLAFGSHAGELRAAAGAPIEVVAIDAGTAPAACAGVDRRVDGAGRSRAAALAGAADAATADIICFVPGRLDALSPGWLAQLAAALDDGAVAATPTLVHPKRRGWQRTEHDQLVRAEGFGIDVDPSGTPLVVARAAGSAIDPQRSPAEVVAAPLAGLAVDRSAYEAAGGLDGAIAEDDAAAVDLCARLRAGGGRIVHVPGAVVVDHRPVGSRTALRRPIDPSARAWHALVERHGPALVRAAGSTAVTASPRWVITTAAPSARVAKRWGDWHLAESLARSLRRLGQDVCVQPHDEAESLATRSRDIHLVVRGLAPVRRTPGQRHILWVISHPEAVEAEEVDGADLVLVASARFATHLRRRSSTPVEVMLQATDPARFHPRPVDPAHRHPVTVVAKTRDVMRRAVADALAAGLRPAIYGSGWTQLVDPALVVSEHVANEELPTVYSSAGVVLNDHWDTMRAWGFVSNRIFDVLACGTPIISDDMAEIHELFGDAVPTYDSSEALGELVRQALEEPDRARAAAEQGRAIVLAQHTFDHRARQLLEVAERHGLLAGLG